ncbi:Thiamine pyrophosphokinase [Mycena kentingensis (nom. inval.)]|nr:Thiamine pyrophosphokinase [Mycena kentingensis (nom. inval.)]
MSGYSYLDLVNQCSNMRVRRPPVLPSAFDDEDLAPFFLSQDPSSPVIGLLRPEIVVRLDEVNQAMVSQGKDRIFSGVPNAYDIPGLGDQTGRISFHASIDTPAKRTAAMKAICEGWRDGGVYPDIIGPGKWRNEMYPVYRDPFGVHDYPSAAGFDADAFNYAFEMERSACALFGVVTYGVHMSAFQENEGGKLKVWVPTRAKTKSMWPGYLDNTVAGGIPAGMPIFEALVKECMEEASLPEELVQAHVRAVGCISYYFRTNKGWLQPEVEYIYDLVIPPGADAAQFQPKPLDGEVERFDFMNKDEIEAAMRSGKFKANCAAVLIDLFIRLGYITPDNEPEYMKIMTGLHTQFDYERWVKALCFRGDTSTDPHRTPAMFAWSKNVRERLAHLPPSLRLAAIFKILEIARFAIPKMHVKGHNLLCQLFFAIGLLPGGGQLDGEGIERPWSMLDGHWNFWNWLKLLKLGASPKQRLVYPPEGFNEQQIRDRFEEEEAKEAVPGRIHIHEIGPAEFMESLLHVEDEQRRIHSHATQKRSKTTSVTINLRRNRQALNKSIQRIYTVVELVPILAPSVLPDAMRANGGCWPGLVVLERQLRDAQCRRRSALSALRMQLHVKQRLLSYKRHHSRNQGANTRSRALVTRNENKILRHADKFQASVPHVPLPQAVLQVSSPTPMQHRAEVGKVTAVTFSPFWSSTQHDLYII